MGWSCSLFLCLSILALAAIAFLLQVTSVSSSAWGHYVARTDLGKQEEKGHFGLWTLCNTKAPQMIEDCDPMDTFFEAPPYSVGAGVVAFLHMFQVLVLMALVIIRALQVWRTTPELLIRPQVLCIANMTIAFLAEIFAILVAIFASIGENKLEYTVTKGWSFWIQIAVIVIDFIVALLCATENFRFWHQHIRESSDPWGQRCETYGNPTFESEIVENNHNITDQIGENGHSSIAMTASSGQPYFANSLGMNQRQIPSSDVLTYANPSYRESSPTMWRKN